MLDSGARRHPFRHPADDESGPHDQQPHAGSVQRVGQPAGESVQTGFRGPVDVIRAAHPHAGHRGEHHQRSPTGLPHRGGQVGQHADLRDVVGVDDGHRVCRIGLGPALVTEHSESEHRSVDRAVLGDDRRDQRSVRIQVVGVELAGGHLRRPGRPDRRHLLVEAIRAAGGQHHGGTGSQSHRKLDTDFAAATENQHRRCARVIHGCDYDLR